MPFYELLHYLRMNSDGILSNESGIIVTELGSKYIESKEGMTYINGTWVPKTIWCRV